MEEDDIYYNYRPDSSPYWQQKCAELESLIKTFKENENYCHIVEKQLEESRLNAQLTHADMERSKRRMVTMDRLILLQKKDLERMTKQYEDLQKEYLEYREKYNGIFDCAVMLYGESENTSKKFEEFKRRSVLNGNIDFSDSGPDTAMNQSLSAGMNKLIESLSHECDGAKKTISDLEEALDAKETAYCELKHDLQVTEMRIDGFQKALEDRDKRIEELDQTLEIIAAEKIELEKLNGNYTKWVKKLFEDNKKMHRQSTLMLNQLDNEELREALLQIEDLEKSKFNYDEKIGQLEEELGKSMANYALVEAEKQLLSLEIEELKKRITELEVPVVPFIPPPPPPPSTKPTCWHTKQQTPTSTKLRPKPNPNQMAMENLIDEIKNVFLKRNGLDHKVTEAVGDDSKKIDLQSETPVVIPRKNRLHSTEHTLQTPLDDSTPANQFFPETVVNNSSLTETAATGTNAVDSISSQNMDSELASKLKRRLDHINSFANLP